MGTYNLSQNRIRNKRTSLRKSMMNTHCYGKGWCHGLIFSFTLTKIVAKNRETIHICRNRGDTIQIPFRKRPMIGSHEDKGRD